MNPITPQLVADPKAQIAVLVIYGAALCWLLRRSVVHGEFLAAIRADLSSIKTIVTNHHKHRLSDLEMRLFGEVRTGEQKDGQDF